MNYIGDGSSPFIVKEWNGKKYIVDIDTHVFRDNLEAYDRGEIFGQFAAVTKIGQGEYEAVRDPLGIQKLFYCRVDSGEYHFSRKFPELFKHDSKIYSLPAGHKVRLTKNGVYPLRSLNGLSSSHAVLKADSFESEANGNVQNSFYAEFDNRMDLAFNSLAEKEKQGWSIFIALSGGLDSTIIASKAAAFLHNPLACTLDLGKSEDSEKSQLIAKQIGISHKVFSVSRDDILDAMEEAPFRCQDFRDFNVHCAALNILLARNIKTYIDSQSICDPEKLIILTGDLMNEFTCDYAGEIIDGKEYYKLPRVGKKQLQNYLIGGLDTSDREISPFASYGFVCIQPFALLFDLYSSLDESVLLVDDPKKLLNSFQIDDTIKDFIPKVKLRAQVGSRESMGILGLCHSMGWDDKTYLKSLLERAGYPLGKVPLFVGRYDVERFLE